MMSETETNIEIEDVLASIRRLVSRDSEAPRPSAVSHRSAAAVAMRAPEPEGDLRPEQAVVSDPDPDPEPVPETEAQATPEPVAEDVGLDVAPEVALPENAAGDMHDAPMAEEDTLSTPESEPDMPVEDASVPEATTEAGPEEEVDEFLVLTPALRVDEAEADAGTEAAQEMPDMRAEAPPKELSEAEALLAEAEAALAGTGALLDASSGFETEEDVAEPTPPSDDLGDELSRLESTIAELEAAVAESDAEFEPEEGHPFVAEGAAPLTELPETFGQEALGASSEPEQDASEAAQAGVDAAPSMTAVEDLPSVEDAMAELAPETVEGGQDAHLDTEPGLEAEEQDGSVDPDLQDAAWGENPSVGMDWAEATLNLASGSGRRRLSVEDAEEVAQEAVSRRSSYESLRDELDGADLPEESYDDPMAYEDEYSTAGSDESVMDDRLLDEAALRDMVGQMVRDELRGALGERITQNVRKLVRREIQRALMGQAYD
ncbi:hypothetical protein CKO11_12780 [Rhodobacter sp. TJ_12]|uniref:hypothetical protein n=1 Tax=Rhodobacter sp. TJ_12 TaxID=2029399 RepID=UPI001CC080C4|nr:hypothetical protein [Rhodobacter sp. TJ_12]MBZ4023333.1 hypothetical protein [Rhodobacter sp. TJ_12]